MPNSSTLRRPPSSRADSDLPNSPSTGSESWLDIVAEQVKPMRYGVVQIVVHDSKVVQIERTERTRFDMPRDT